MSTRVPARVPTEEELLKLNASIDNVRKTIDKEKSNGKRRNCCVVTYGCQQNEADSEQVAGMAVEMGYNLTETTEDADLIIVNTCAVREHAEKKVFSITGGYKHLKDANPELIIGICGCMVSEEKNAEKFKKSYPYVDFTFGTESLWKFPEILDVVVNKKKRSFILNSGDEVICERTPSSRKSTFTAWLSIMYGCNNFCTYCIVPYVRGRERSRRPEVIVEEAKQLISQGYKEITLLGQNVNSYGKEYGVSFASLIKQIAELDGDFIIRFMSSHPKDMSDELIQVIAECPKIERHIHLPFQSGSSRVLKLMNRHYTKEDYLALIKRIRDKNPDISLSADVMVGFPGETEEDFQETLDLIRQVEFDMMFSFIYSPREGTPAAKEVQMSEKDKTDRYLRLLKVQEPIAEQRAQRFVGRVEKVLVEGRSKNNNEKFTGRDSGLKIILFDGNDEMTGKFADIEITEAHAFALYGKVIRVY
jgi:tRNA-2-methylthio-N6-dimethylallyladenosine synthase